MQHLFGTGVEQYRNRYRTYFKRFSVENLSRKSQSFLQKLTNVPSLTLKCTRLLIYILSLNGEESFELA